MRWRIALLLALITTINYVDRAVFGIVAPVVRGTFSIDDASYGLITSGFLLAYGVGQLVSGPLIDRFGTRRAFGLAALLWSLSTMLHAFGRGVFSFLLLRISLGLTEAANFPAATKAVAEWFPARERATAVGIFMLGAGLGAIITPPLTVWTIKTIGWQWAFIIPGALGLVWAVLWQRWYYPPETHPTVSAEERALILADRTPGVVKTRWSTLLGDQAFWGLMAARVMSDFPFYFLLFWLPQYLIDARGFDLTALAVFVWMPWLFADLGAYAGGWLSSQLVQRGWSVNRSRKTVIWSGAVLFVAILPAFYVDSAGVALALICVGLFANQLKQAVLFTVPSDLYPAGSVATVWGVFGAVGSLGAAVLGYVAGQLIASSGYEPVFLGISTLHIVSAALLTLLIPNIRLQTH
ncbi:MAG: MFS transporter [Pseudomonadota bacterium]